MCSADPLSVSGKIWSNSTTGRSAQLLGKCWIRSCLIVCHYDTIHHMYRNLHHPSVLHLHVDIQSTNQENIFYFGYLSFWLQLCQLLNAIKAICIFSGKLKQRPLDASISYCGKGVHYKTAIRRIIHYSNIVRFYKYGGTAIKCISLRRTLSWTGRKSPFGICYYLVFSSHILTRCIDWWCGMKLWSGFETSFAYIITMTHITFLKSLYWFYYIRIVIMLVSSYFRASVVNSGEDGCIGSEDSNDGFFEVFLELTNVEALLEYKEVFVAYFLSVGILFFGTFLSWHFRVCLKRLFRSRGLCLVSTFIGFILFNSFIFFQVHR